MASARLAAARSTRYEASAQAGLNTAKRMVDLFDGHPGDETPSAVVIYLWRPWEHEQGGGPIAYRLDPQEQRIAEAESAAAEAKSWGRHHEEAYFRGMAEQLRGQRAGGAHDEEPTALR